MFCVEVKVECSCVTRWGKGCRFMHGSTGQQFEPDENNLQVDVFSKRFNQTFI